jgi:hypothetical protein
MKLVKNSSYKWQQILAGLSVVSGPVFYLLHHPGSQAIAAACLSIDINPRAPYEIIPATGRFIKPWADKFATQPEPVPVFVREADRKWYYRGQFKVVAQSSDPLAIRHRGKQANRTDIYKILFLEEVR